MNVEDNILCELSHGLLEISGADAVSFLQGQVTNDVKLLTLSNNAHYSAYCTPKGRMLALFLAFAHADYIHLQLNRALLEPILKRLKMYVMRAKVVIKDASDDIVKFGLHGPQASAILARSFSTVPTQDYQLSNLDNTTLLKLPALNGCARFEIFTSKSQAADVFERLKTDCKVVDQAHWDWLEIQVGIPEIYPETQEQFVPQMLNLDALNGINFKKGCYTGQEIVARTHYLGKVKRRTFLAHIASETAPKAGDVLLDASGQDAGQIVRVAADTTGFAVLAELRLEAVEAGSVSWQGHPLSIQPLPYALS